MEPLLKFKNSGTLKDSRLGHWTSRCPPSLWSRTHMLHVFAHVYVSLLWRHDATQTELLPMLVQSSLRHRDGSASLVPTHSSASSRYHTGWLGIQGSVGIAELAFAGDALHRRQAHHVTAPGGTRSPCYSFTVAPPLSGCSHNKLELHPDSARSVHYSV